MTGPYETERQARAVVAHIYDAAHASSRRGVLAEENYLLLFRACEAAGIELGSPASYDRRILAWLAGFEPETCAVVAGLIARAHPAAPAEREGGKLTAIRGVLDAFDWERDDRQYALERIEQIAAGSRTASGIEPGGSAHISALDLRTVLSALDVAADAKRDAADVCGDCDARPDGALCATCEWRLAQAEEYDALAGQLRRQP
jgi:hypothetical protein